MVLPRKSSPRLPDAWNLEACMQARGIRFARGLHAALALQGLVISPSSVSRLVYKRPQQLDLALLLALCEVLVCTPNDLLMPVKWVDKKTTENALSVKLQSCTTTLSSTR